MSGQEEVDAAAAAAAAAAFDTRNHSAALLALEGLRDRLPTDPKVLHNAIITRHVAGAQRNERELIENLTSLKTLCEEQAGAGGGGGAGSHWGAGAPPSPRLTAAETRHETALLSLNLAAAHARLGQHRRAVALLEPVVSLRGSLGERPELQAATLLQESYLALGASDKAYSTARLIAQEATGGQGLGSLSSAQLGLAMAHLSAGRTDSAKGCLPKEGDIHSADGHRASIIRSNVLMAEGEHAAAAALLEGVLLELQHSPQPATQVAALSSLARALSGAGKPNHAILRLREALAVLNSPTSGVPLNASAVICYQTGLQLLGMARHREAALMLQQSAVFHHESPVIWLRLAECCVGAYQNRRTSPTVTSVSATPDVRAPGCSPTGSPQDTDNLLGLHVAQAYLLNADYILRQMEAQHSEDPKPSGDEAAEPPHSGCGSVDGLTVEEIARVRQSVLRCTAYVSLAQGNPTVALSKTKELLAVGCDAQVVHEARYYAAEALCLLGKTSEAAEQLQLAVRRMDA